MSNFRIMFICTGNICRSPLAHAVFEHLVKDQELENLIQIESSGTGAYHVGEQSDSRMRQVAKKHGVHINHRSQQLLQSDLLDFNLLLAMDNQNYQDVLALCRTREEQEKIKMFRDYDPEGRGDVPDPWYGGLGGFELVWNIVYRTSVSLLEQVQADLGI